MHMTAGTGRLNFSLPLPPRFVAIQHVLLNLQKLILGGALAGIDIVHGSIISIITVANS